MIALLTLVVFSLSLLLYFAALQTHNSHIYRPSPIKARSIQFMEHTLGLNYPVQLTRLDVLSGGTMRGTFTDNEGDSLVWTWEGHLAPDTGSLLVTLQIRDDPPILVPNGSDEEIAMLLLLDFNLRKSWSRSQQFRGYAPDRPQGFRYLSMEERNSILRYMAWSLSGARRPDPRAFWSSIVISGLLPHVFAVWITFLAGGRRKMLKRVAWLEFGGLAGALIMVSWLYWILRNQINLYGTWDLVANLLWMTAIVVLIYFSSFGMRSRDSELKRQ